MNNKEILETIISIEQKLLSESKSVKYLIVVRVCLFYFLRGKFSGENKDTLSSRPFRKRLKNLCDALYSSYVVFFGQKKELLVGPLLNRNIKVGGDLLSKHYDSFKFHLEKNENSLLSLEVGAKRESTKYSGLNVQPLVNILSRFVKIPIDEHGRIKMLCDLAVNTLSETKETEHDKIHHILEKTICEYYRKLKVYELLFKPASFKRAYFVVYYDIDMLAMIHVLRSKNVDVVDYQHGIQNDFQPMYNHLTLYVDGQFKSLPNIFYVWDTVAERRISRAVQCSDSVEVKIVGRYWEDFYTEKIKSLESQSELVNLVGSKKVILIALQAFPAFFNFELLKLLKVLSKDWFVIIRPHPISPLSQADINRYFSQADYEAHIIIDENKFGLDSLFPQIDYCITGFSTVGLEAYYAGVKVVFTHDNARQGLSEYLTFDGISYASNCSDMLAVLGQ